MLTQVSFPAFFNLPQICPFCALRPQGCCCETAGPGLARTAAFSRTQNSGVTPSHRTSTAQGHGASGHRTGSSSRAELIWLLGKVPAAATSPWISTAALPVPQHAGVCPRVPLPAQLPHDCQSRAGASPGHDPPVPSEGQHSRFWERWCGGKSHAVVGGLPSTTSWEQPGQERYSSASGGGVRCSWKFSFWKTLLVAGSPWETLSSPCLSPPPWPPRASSVRRASCKENPLVTLGTLLQGTQSPGRHCVPAAARETLTQIKPRAWMAWRNPTEPRAGHQSSTEQLSRGLQVALKSYNLKTNPERTESANIHNQNRQEAQGKCQGQRELRSPWDSTGIGRGSVPSDCRSYSV